MAAVTFSFSHIQFDTESVRQKNLLANCTLCACSCLLTVATVLFGGLAAHVRKLARPEVVRNERNFRGNAQRT